MTWSLPDNRRWGMVPNSFYEANVTLAKTIQKKKSTDLMNIDAKILNKILATSTQQYIKIIIHYDQVEFTLGMRDWLNIKNSINLNQCNNEPY